MNATEARSRFSHRLSVVRFTDLVGYEAAARLHQAMGESLRTGVHLGDVQREPM